MLLKPSIECSGEYGNLLALYITVLVLAIVAPLLIVFFLYRRRSTLHHHAMQRRFGALYTHFTPRLYWFECYQLYRRVALLAVFFVIARVGVLFALPVALTAMCLLLLTVHLVLRPYEERELNLLEVVLLGGKAIGCPCFTVLLLCAADCRLGCTGACGLAVLFSTALARASDYLGGADILRLHCHGIPSVPGLVAHCTKAGHRRAPPHQSSRFQVVRAFSCFQP